jgi:FkbM family methyltransferase
MYAQRIAAVQRILKLVANPVIVELGAYTGEDFETMLGKEMIHILVEPVLENIVRVERRPLRRPVNAAIAAQAGKRKFHFSDLESGGIHYSWSGSILSPKEHLRIYPTTHFSEKSGDDGFVQCITLDELYLQQNLDRVDLIWCDIQGAESEMIRGGTVALKHTHYLLMEAENEEQYEGQVVRSELLKMLSPEWSLVESFVHDVLLENTEYGGV